MKSTPVKGTRDYLPQEAELRDHLQNVILETYLEAGYQRITTPALESSENLDKSDGGENLNLIFRVLKRGRKLESALSSDSVSEKDLSDMGLRYDLTLPLSRYYSNNRQNLTDPFKVIQMDRVYRAERPQKGRLREFMQCDIDIIGNSEKDAETDLILTTAKALTRTGLKNFKIKLNDRRILRAIFNYAGFDEDKFDHLAIIFDKLDKIGLDGVHDELLSEGFNKDAVEKFTDLFRGEGLSLKEAASLEGAAEYAERLQNIIDTVNEVTKERVKLEFSPSLVRGQGYYTGTIFEVEAEGYSGAVAGGGRYDNLIGKFLNENIPAVGFSIGFERIFGILSEKMTRSEYRKKRIALFFSTDESDLVPAHIQAEELRKNYFVSVIRRPKKLGKYLGKLENAGFDGYLVYGEGTEPKLFENRG